MNELRSAQTQHEQLFYAFVLRNLTSDWTRDTQLAYFSWLNLAEAEYQGGASFRHFVSQIRRDAVAKLSGEEKRSLADVIAGKRSIEAVNLETTRQFLHNWQIEDLLPLLSKVGSGRSFERGKAAYHAAQCQKCHRFAGDGGSTGPDITTVGNRFDARYILESFLEPSKAISDQYQNNVILTNAGEIVTGRVVGETPTHLTIRTSPFARQLTKIAKAHIEERGKSKVSTMPVGLINVLTKDEILDLIAYLRSAGRPNDKAFRKP